MPRGRYTVAAVLVATVAIAIVLIAAELAGEDVEKLTGDVVSTASVHPWTGFLSTLGLLAWAACFGVCALAAAVLRMRGDQRAPFFAVTALLLAYLALDDAYLIHEYLADDVIGVPQPVVYTALAAVIVYTGRRFRRVVAATDVRLLAIALGALSASVAIDVVEQQLHLAGVEEWLKLSGLAALSAWCFTAAARALDDPLMLNSFRASRTGPRTAEKLSGGLR
jgi:hypothetical protein